MTAAEQVPPVDLDAMRIDQRLAANRRPADIPAAARAADRVIHTHVPALLALVEQQAAENAAVRAIVDGWISDANNGYGSDPDDLANLLEDHDASRAPESPAGTATPRATPDA